MNRKLFLVVAILAMALPAAADFQTVSQAYEVKLSNLTVPPSQSGRILFKECDECDSMSVRLTANTDFVVNGRSVQFEKFRTIANQTHNADTVPVTVLHHLDSGTVVRLSLTVK
jgi:hypothetical protein